MIIDRYTKIELSAGEAVVRAADNLKRDMAKILGSPHENKGCTDTEAEKAEEKDQENGRIRLIKGTEERECFTLQEKGGNLTLSASDELGFVYGLYEDQQTVPRCTPVLVLE